MYALRDCIMILLVDNNDSFTHNIAEALYQITDKKICIRTSTHLHIDDVEKYQKIIFSPGPCLPRDFPLMHDILYRYKATKPILGVCLGHQAICEFFGATIERLQHVLHGIDSTIYCDKHSTLFKNKTSMLVGRYHSWIACNIPKSLKITARDENGHVMAVEHISYSIYGVQFHPESHISIEGVSIFENFINA